jgi:CHAT domain-containing protein
MLSRPPGTTPPLNDHLRVLVIADPAPEPELQLPFARIEGKTVVDRIKRLNRENLHIDVESRIGAAECDFVEILALILTGGFDIIHYAGHGDYDPAQPGKAGWVFGKDRLLTASEIFRARRVPRLVFANACFSGVIHAQPDSDELARGAATLAQAFFERGVPNYIGSGWPVNDMQASVLADTFYEWVLGGRDRPPCSIGIALKEARDRVFEQSLGSTWGTYQLYGDPEAMLVRIKDDAS